jgi:hypothetical protein
VEVNSPVIDQFIDSDQITVDPRTQLVLGVVQRRHLIRLALALTALIPRHARFALILSAVCTRR